MKVKHDQFDKNLLTVTAPKSKGGKIKESLIMYDNSEFAIEFPGCSKIKGEYMYIDSMYITYMTSLLDDIRTKLAHTLKEKSVEYFGKEFAYEKFITAIQDLELVNGCNLKFHNNLSNVPVSVGKDSGASAEVKDGVLGKGVSILKFKSITFIENKINVTITIHKHKLTSTPDTLLEAPIKVPDFEPEPRLSEDYDFEENLENFF